MAGKSVGDTLQFNSLQAGQLPLHEGKNPASPRYAHGMERAEGVIAMAGRLTHAPVQNVDIQSHAYPADYCPYPDASYYLRNTASGATATSVTADVTGLTTAVSLPDKLEEMITTGNFLAYTATEGFPGGKHTSFNGALNNAACKVGSTGNKFLVGESPLFVRAVAYTDNSGVRRWAVVGDIGLKTKQGWVEWSINIKIKNIDETPSANITICNGNSSYTEIKKVSTVEVVEGVYTVTPETKSIPGPAVTLVSDLYLVGKMSMFDLVSNLGDATFTNARDRSFTITSHSTTTYTFTESKLLVTEIPSNQDVYILAWGSGGASPVWDIGASDDSAVQALKWTTSDIMTVDPGFTGGATFAYLTARNKIVGKRRVGIAQIGSGATGTGEKSGCVGFSKVFGVAGDGNVRTVGAAAETDPYAVLLDSKAPLWIEVAYQGVFCGTDDAEYLISNEQGAKSYTLQKISSIGGTPAGNQDICDASTQLDGVIYFITKSGFATFQFSNEAQGYVPKRINLSDYGFGKPTSIASLKASRSIIIFTTLNVVADTYGTYQTNRIVIYTPESGAITSVDFHDIVVSGATYKAVAVRTDKDATYVIFKNGSNRKMVKIDGSVVSGSTIRTTRFMVGPEKIPKINKVYLMMSDSFGGRVRVEGQTEWEQIPYSSNEIAMGSFTGTKEIMVRDTVGDHSVGKYVEINFSASEKMNLVGVAVGGDS